MVTFFVVLTVVAMLGLVISAIMLIGEYDPFALWVTLMCICGIMCFVGPIGGTIAIEEDKSSVEQTTQVEHSEDAYEQYNYCPYCGKEIK